MYKYLKIFGDLVLDGKIRKYDETKQNIASYNEESSELIFIEDNTKYTIAPEVILYYVEQSVLMPLELEQWNLELDIHKILNFLNSENFNYFNENLKEMNKILKFIHNYSIKYKKPTKKVRKRDLIKNMFIKD